MDRRSMWMLMMLVLLVACGDGTSTRPSSGGKPFEVLVVGDDDGQIARQLVVDAEGLPQREPCFDVSRVEASRWKGNLRMARAVVIRDTSKTLRVTSDTYASPQIIVHTDGHGGARLRQVLADFERRVATDRLRKRHNPQAEEAIHRLFGAKVLVPSDMNSSKEAPGFLWLSTNTATAMRNICVYRGEDRDSVMRLHIKGETDSMYMRTVQGTVRERPLPDGSVYRYGLWEMKGDAMGGPFASITRGGITVEAFVYAPESKKRNLIRQLDAVLYSLETQ